MPTYTTKSTVDDKTPAGGNKPHIKIEDLVDIYKFKSGKYTSLRLVGPMLGIAMHWIEILTKDGNKVKIPKLCLSYDRDADTIDSTVQCPYCENLHADYKARQQYYNNAIIRSLEDKLPDDFDSDYSKSERKTGFIDDGSDAETPIRVVRVTPGVVTKIQALKQLNIHKVKGKSVPCGMADDEFGCDLLVKYDANAKNASDAYNVQKGESSPLSEVEQSYLHFNIEVALDTVFADLSEDLKQAKAECKNLMTKVVKEKEGIEPEYSEDVEMAVRKTSKAKSQVEESDIEENSEAPAPKRGRAAVKPAAKRGRPAKVQEESSEENSENSDEESSDVPAPKRGRPAAKPAAKRGRAAKEESSDDENSDEESSENSDEESSDVPAPKRGRPAAKPAAKRGSKVEESSDENSDEESSENSDEESSDVPAPKRGRPAAKPAAKRGRAAKEESSDEENSEVPSHKRRSSPTVKPVVKRGRAAKEESSDEENSEAPAPKRGRPAKK